MSAWLAVALGAAAGGLLRSGLALAWAADGAVGWPWPTLLVNLLGSALIGAFWARVGPESTVEVSLERRLLVMTGFCGGFTTFSAFGVETVELLAADTPGSALVLVLVNGLGAPLAAACGWMASRRAS
jgi:CrcB protein